MKSNQKGITLIVLIITIIVLLILSLVTINMLFGENNIIENAGNAKIQNERAEIDDVLQAAVINISIEQGKKLDNLDDYYKTDIDFKTKGKVSGQTYRISNYVTTLAENTSIDKVTFKISKIGGTGTEFEYEIEVKAGKVICKSNQPSGGSEENPEDPDNPQEDELNKEYTITYNKDGGEFEDENKAISSYKKGDIVSFPVLEKEGAVFDGWYTSQSFESGTQIASTTKNTTGNIVLYAKWIVESNPNYFIYSNSNNGNVTIQRLSKASDFSDLSVVNGEDAYANDAEDIINLVIPKTVTINGNVCNVNGLNSSVFDGKNKIKKLILPSTITSIGMYAFRNCSGIEDLTIPITIIHAGNSRYIGCTGIKKVRFTVGANNNGEGQNYSNFQTSSPWYITSQYNIANNIDEKIKIIFDDGITKIGSYMFDGCVRMKMVEFPSKLVTIGEGAFKRCGMEGELILTEGITQIGSYAFQNCTEINGILNFPSTINTISYCMFDGCTGIKKLIIPPTITFIDGCAFRNCSGIEEMIVPITIAHAGSSKYDGCTGIKKVRFTVGKDSNGNDSGVGVSYSSNSSATPWYITSNYNVKNNINQKIDVEFDDEITQIGVCMFLNCAKINLVQLPRKLIKIGDSAFRGCSGMEGELTFGNKLIELGSSAFYGCTGLTGTIRIPELTNKTIPSSLFEGCAGIKKLIIPPTITSISSYAFKNCSGIEEMIVPITVAHAGSSKYDGCTGIKKVRFTVGKDSNGNDSGVGVSYSSNSSATPWYITSNYNVKNNINQKIDVEFDDEITQIGVCMFLNCAKINLVQLPRKLIKIGDSAFRGCSGMEGELTFGNKLIELGSSAFYGCTGLTGTIRIPELTNKTIPSSLFEGCAGIKKLIIPPTITSISSYAFKNCSGIEEMIVPITIAHAGNYKYDGCTGIKKVRFTLGKDSNGNDSGIGPSYSSNSTASPWYFSRTNNIQIIFENGITQIGQNMFNGQTNATYYFTGTKTQWENVIINSNNNITIPDANFNYSE